MKASIIILNFNGGDLTIECLDSLKLQTFKNFEVIVVDNNSTDGSLELLQSYKDINLISLTNNTGFTGGVNAGIKAAKGELIALLNNDAVAHKDWLKELVAAMDVADIAAAKILHYDDHTLIDSTGDHYSKWGLPYPRGRGEKDTQAYSGYPEIFAASGGACIYKREVFETVGMLDPAFFAYLEDIDMCFRARLAGYTIVLAPKAEIYHHIGATSSKMGHFARHQFIKNSLFVYYKDLPASLFWRHSLRFAFVQTLLLAAAVKNGALGAALGAYIAFLGHLPKLLKDRRQIQKNRVLKPAELEKLLTDHWPLRTRLVSAAAKKL